MLALGADAELGQHVRPDFPVSVAVVSSMAAARIAGTSVAGFTEGFSTGAVVAVVAAVVALIVPPSAKKLTPTT